jgi:hypothetical protein
MPRVNTIQMEARQGGNFQMTTPAQPDPLISQQIHRRWFREITDFVSGGHLLDPEDVVKPCVTAYLQEHLREASPRWAKHVEVALGQFGRIKLSHKLVLPLSAVDIHLRETKWTYSRYELTTFAELRSYLSRMVCRTPCT